MNNDWICPICKGHINVDKNLIFSVKKGDNHKGLVILSTELGNFSVKTHEKFTFKDGEDGTFYCPICHANLTSDVDEHLLRVIMVDEKGEQSEIFISDICGEKSTYQIKDKKVKRLGKDAEKYQKYWDVPEEYKKYL